MIENSESKRNEHVNLVLQVVRLNKAIGNYDKLNVNAEEACNLVREKIAELVTPCECGKQTKIRFMAQMGSSCPEAQPVYCCEGFGKRVYEKILKPLASTFRISMQKRN